MLTLMVSQLYELWYIYPNLNIDVSLNLTPPPTNVQIYTLNWYIYIGTKFISDTNGCWI